MSYGKNKNGEYFIDTALNLNHVPRYEMGDIVNDISTGEKYMLNSSKQWIKQPSISSPIIATSLSGSINLSQINEVQYHGGFNLFDPDGCDNYFYDYDGTIIEARDGRVMSNFIQISAGQKVTRNGNLTGVVCFFDANKKFIKRIDAKNLSTITAPENPLIKYVRLAVVNSPNLVIVYGNTIPDSFGDFYTISKLKITEKNLDNQSLGFYTSPNGTLWKILVDDNGNLSTKKINSENINNWPENFFAYKINGAANPTIEEILITPHIEATNSYIFSIDYEGNLKKYKQIPKSAQNFKVIKYQDGTIRYCYMSIDEKIDNSYYSGVLTILDENWNIVVENLGSPSGDPVNTHAIAIFSDNHYLVATNPNKRVTNVPGYEEQEIQLQGLTLQEIKNNEIIWEWDITNYPQLYNICRYYNVKKSWDNQLVINSPERYVDYSHFNSISIDKNTGDLLISLRYIGLLKIKYSTKEILWIMSRYYSDISEIENENICYLQHDAKYYKDGSIIVFDNNNDGEYSRICRYWIDENNKQLNNYQIFNIPRNISDNGGSVFLVKEDTNTYLLSYGNPNLIAIEQYNFNDKTSDFTFEFEQKDLNLYSIFIKQLGNFEEIYLPGQTK